MFGWQQSFQHPFCWWTDVAKFASVNIRQVSPQGCVSGCMVEMMHYTDAVQSPKAGT